MPCTKTSYSTEAFALADLKRFLKSKRRNKPTGVYLCNNCNTWHLTSDNGILFDRIKELKQVISRISLEKEQLKSDNKKLQNKCSSLESVLKEVRTNYQNNGINRKCKRNGR